MFASILREFGLIRVAEMAGEDKEEDPDKDVKDAFSEIRQVVTGQGDKEDSEEEEDDDEKCGFCIFMKAGGCKKEFTEWSKCVDAKRGDGHNFTEECREPTINLQHCMEEHRDYYQDFMMDAAALDEEDSGDRSIQAASPKEETNGKKDIKGNTEANKQVKVPEDHDSSSGTQNPNKGKNDARGVTDHAKEKQGGSGDKPQKSSGGGEDSKEQKGSGEKPKEDGKKENGAGGKDAGEKGEDGRKEEDALDDEKGSKGKVPEGKKPEEPHAEQKQSDKHDIKGHTEANIQVKVPEDHDSSSGTKDNKEHPDGHVVDDGADTKRGIAVGASASAIDDVNTPLPPTDHVLSGIEEKFEPGGNSPEGDDGEGEGEGEGASEEGEEEEQEEKPAIEIKTASYDARFPATNQARHCYTRYNEYHRCVAQKGEGADECRVFQRAYRSLCPGEWLERWNEQREEGTWPGRY